MRRRADVSTGAYRLFDDRPLAGGKMEWQAHNLERQKKISENDCRIHPQCFGGGDRHFSRELGLLHISMSE